MLYAILCYNSEDAVGSWSKEYHDETMTRLHAVNDKLARQGRLGPVAHVDWEGARGVRLGGSLLASSLPKQ